MAGGKYRGGRRSTAREESDDKMSFLEATDKPKSKDKSFMGLRRLRSTKSTVWQSRTKVLNRMNPQLLEWLGKRLKGPLGIRHGSISLGREGHSAREIPKRTRTLAEEKSLA